jgi:hypothetical protein
MTDTTVTFRMPGKAMGVVEGSELYQRPHLYTLPDNHERYQAAIRAGEALRLATGHKNGHGWSYAVTCDPAAAEVIRGYCLTVGETFASQGGYDQAETRADGRALLLTAERIAAAVRAGGAR